MSISPVKDFSLHKTLRVPVTDTITGVAWYKWDTTGTAAKVSHLAGNKEQFVSKIPNKTNIALCELNETDRRRLVDYFNLLIEIDQREKARYRYVKLKKSPKGFPMDGEGRPCGLCFQPVYGDSSGWFDKWGLKCSNYQDAVNKRKIPGSLCGDFEHKKSIPDTVLAMELGIKVGVIRKCIRGDKINARRIPNGPYLILRKDNPNISTMLIRD